MKKIYYLNGCSTCQRVLRALQPPEDIPMQDVKTNPITQEQLEQLAARSGSYKSLFNTRALLYRERGLSRQYLSETDYKNLMLEHYTFMRRPVVVFNEHIFIGSSKKQTEVAKAVLHA